ncbi:MAG: amidohydrolase family protein [Christensenellaceae bacterium]|nr:amidohydrolase family protein [Christensenellaceae bacterium]
MIVDFHTHAFNDNLAAKAMDKLEACGGLPRQSDGTVADTARRMKEQGVDVAVILNIATSPRSTPKVNDFAKYVDGLPGMVGFGSVHPAYEHVDSEIDRIVDMGLKGVKLHPHYQEFYVDDENVYPMYEKLAKAGLYVAFHAGFDPYAPDTDYILPAAARRAHDAVPGMKMILAHFGGMYHWDEVEEYLVGQDNIWFDTALAAGNVPQEQLKRVIKNHGYEKILLGSDFPWHPSTAEIGMIRDLDIPEEQKEAILGGNAQKLLGL